MKKSTTSKTRNNHNNDRSFKVVEQIHSGRFYDDGDTPLHFKRNNDSLAICNSIYQLLAKDIHDRIDHVPRHGNNLIELVSSMSNDTSCSIKSRLSEKHSDSLRAIFDNLIPSIFNIQWEASPPIIFYSQASENVCPTHFDRDNSVLLMLNGHKKVFVAHSKIIQTHYSNLYMFTNYSGMHDLIKPFEESEKGRQTKGWVEINLSAGDCLYLPKHVVHSIKSASDTLAVSFQVCFNPHPDSKIPIRLLEMPE